MIPAQVQVVQINQGPSQWSSGIFDCDQDCGSFVLGCCCPCIQYGTNMDILSKSGCAGPCCSYYCLACVGCHCIIGSSGRGNIRNRYLIPGDGCEDCLLHYFCIPCVLSQEYRELMKRETNKVIVQTNVIAQPMMVAQPMMQPQQYPPQQYPPQQYPPQQYPPVQQGYPQYNQN